MRDVIIRMENVDVEYATAGAPTRRVLHGINLEIERGEFVSIVGQTGCGKSTLLRLVLGEQKPTRGRVLVNGDPTFAAGCVLRLCPSEVLTVLR